MAQHDYVIDNQAFPATRADLNSVLQAIVTNNSGSSAPSTTFANQIWYDSSANIIYIRNEDNDANIPLFNLDQSNDVASLLATIIDITDASGTNTAGTSLTIQGGAGTGSGAAGKIFLKTATAGSSGSSVNAHATQMTIGGSGVGIGTESPDAQLHISGDDVTNQVIIENTSDAADNAPDLLLKRNSSSPADGDEVGQIVFQGRNDNSQFPQLAQIRVIYKDVTDTTEDAAMAFRLITAGSNSEVMRLDGGDLFVTKTSQNVDTVGHELRADGVTVHTASGASPLFLNRKTSDGVIQTFMNDGATDGQINTKSGDIAVGTGDTGLRFNDGSDAIQPFDVSSNAARNDAIDLGTSGAKFDDIFATNGTIQTSDENEKQDISSLTSAEISAATEISKLFKTYKYKDAVASKGDNARIHTGVIAQQVEQAMTDAGLDASKYSFWCSDTWWEHGVDDYYTADEAPEGSTQKTLLGIRYPELLAFVGAATEQRLTSIESRLTALEG